MALAICTSCTTAYAPGVPKCPQCASSEHVEQGSPEHLDMLTPAPVKAKTKPAAAPDA
jgi:uncharacterized OB-fold protein